MMFLMVSFCAVCFPQDVFDEIWDLFESVSEVLPTHVKCFMYIFSYYPN